MATVERDNTSPSEQRLPSWENPKYTDKPLFVNRHNRPTRESIWEYRRNRKADLSTNATGANEKQERVVVGPITWRSGSGGMGMGLTEAFARTNEHGDFIPRTRPVLGGREDAVGDSRIPRTRTYLPDAAKGSPGLSGVDRPTYTLNGRGDRATSAPIVNYETDDSGVVKDTSPSPGPRDRRWSGQESGSDASNHSSVEGLGYFERRRRELEQNVVKDDAYYEKKRLKDEKDRAYIEKALKSTTPLFVGIHGSSRVLGTARTLERKASESSLEEREPPITIPSTWGSRARKNREWMQKIVSPESSIELKDSVEAPEVVDRPQTASDIILPSVEDGSWTQEITPPASRPASAQPMHTSPEKSKVWDADLDFTAQSLQISTSPQLRVTKSSKLDELRSREIQNLTARAVATNRLEEIRERNSEERSLVSEPVQTNTEKEDVVGKEAAKETLKEQEPVVEEHREKTTLKEEGERIPLTPITIFGKAKDFDDYVQRNKITLSRSSSSSSCRPRSSQGVDQSRELLRKLSRSLSSSPKVSDPVNDPDTKREAPNRSDPVKGLELKEDPNRLEAVKQQEKKSRFSQSQIRKTSDAKKEEEKKVPNRSDFVLASGTSTPAVEADDPEERIAAEARLFDLQDKSERGSIRAPSPFDDVGETPRPKPDPLSLPTPKVTGAYIETPLIRKARSTSPRSKTTEVGPSSRFRDSRPPLVNTAKHVSAIEDLRRIQIESRVDDSTLDDLEFLENGAPAEMTETVKSTPDVEYTDSRHPLSQKEIDRRIEEIMLERMNKSLKATTTSIRDARKGIERLEEQVSSSFISVAQPLPSDIMYINVKLPIPKLWVTQTPPKAGMKPTWKLTWIGLILSLLTLWYVSESAMCAQFCHPKNSRVNTWQPSDPFFPWAIPTKLDQWTGEIVSTSISNVADAFGLKGGWDLGIPAVPQGYKGGPIGVSDWWLGRDRPVGIKSERDGSSFSDDETI